LLYNGNYSSVYITLVGKNNNNNITVVGKNNNNITMVGKNNNNNITVVGVVHITVVDKNNNNNITVIGVVYITVVGKNNNNNITVVSKNNNNNNITVVGVVYITVVGVVYITVVGKKGETTEHCLHKKVHNDSEKTRLFNFKDSRAYGKGWSWTPKNIARARHALSFYALWAATPETAFFPCYEWVTNRHENLEKMVSHL
jgi:hypothetical protein